jgi:hypothetical protein
MVCGLSFPEVLVSVAAEAGAGGGLVLEVEREFRMVLAR